MESCKLSKTLMKRLPAYLSHLKALPGEDCNVSATAIANALGLGDVQVRKDLAKISDAGRRRTGRSRNQLIRDIEKHLNYAVSSSAVIIGSGVPVQALIGHCGLEASGLNVLACFDPDPEQAITENALPVYSMNRLESFCKCYHVHIGIIAVPAEQAQGVCDALVACGIRGIWNFAPVPLRVPNGIALQNENFAVSISSLRMQLKRMSERACLSPGAAG